MGMMYLGGLGTLPTNIPANKGQRIIAYNIHKLIFICFFRELNI